MKTVVGIVNLQESNELLRELAATRAVEALPFAGRYRVVDFSLSNMINSGVNSVGLMLPDYSRAILDHIRSGKDWDLARRRDGLTYLPAALPGNDARKGDLKDIYANLDFAELSDKKYVLFVNGSYVYNIDFQKVLDFHKSSDADITMIYKTVAEDKEGHTVTIETSTNGIVTDLAESNGIKKGAKAVMSAYLMPVPTFAYIVRSTYERGGQDLLIDGIIRHASEHKISAYEHKGYVARINSTLIAIVLTLKFGKNSSCRKTPPFPRRLKTKFPFSTKKRRKLKIRLLPTVAKFAAESKTAYCFAA